MPANVHDDGPASSGLAAVDPLHAGVAPANGPAGGGCGCGCGGSCGCTRGAANAVEEPAEDADPAARLAPAAVSSRAAMTRSMPSQRRQRPAPERAAELRPSSCADGNCGTGPRLVYALGELGYDFGSQARHDAIDNELDEGKFAHNPDDLLEFLQRPANRHCAASLIWTLHDDETPGSPRRGDDPDLVLGPAMRRADRRHPDSGRNRRCRPRRRCSRFVRQVGGQGRAEGLEGRQGLVLTAECWGPR